jgi:hypothetical protein
MSKRGDGMPDFATSETNKLLEKNASRVNQAARDCAISRAFLNELLKSGKLIQLVDLGHVIP